MTRIRNLILSLAILASGTLFLSCSSSPLIGKWQDPTSGTGIEFLKNGSMVPYSNDDFESGTYKVLSGDNVRVTLTSFGTALTTTWQYKITGDSMAVEADGNTTNYTRVSAFAQAGSATPTLSGSPKPSVTPSKATPVETAPPVARMSWKTPPPMSIDPQKAYTATIKVIVDGENGSIVIELFAADAPQTVNDFVFLARQGFYNGIKFHRVIRSFMIQTGDPKGDGSGGPGYEFADELPPKYSYDPGIVAMANSGPNTNGSQFFICTGTQAKSLNTSPNYTQFGKVISGMDVVSKIAYVPVARRNPTDPETSTPTVDVRMVSVTIEEVAK